MKTTASFAPENLNAISIDSLEPSKADVEQMILAISEEISATSDYLQKLNQRLAQCYAALRAM